jgi:signal transduction histidine kinase
MFHSAALKLTLWYLAIIMAISLVFSVSLYHVSGDELGRNVNRQIRYYSDILAPNESVDYGLLRQHQLDQDLNHLKGNLVFFNILVLTGGGIASYWLARRTLDPIEQALDAQSRFASDASHELRTPLTAIQAENEVALRNKSLTKGQAVDLLKSNLEEVAKLRSLSEGLLKLASGNGQVHDPQTVALKSVAQAAIGRYEKAAQSKKIRLVNDIRETKVMGDANGLTELLAIFIDNAIKYSPPGSSVKLSAARHGKQTRLVVEDRGQGIQPADLPHIFNRFYRTDSSRHKNGNDGFGLGLAIAKQIAQAHNGYIEVNSTPGKGTKFTVFLPAA